MIMMKRFVYATCNCCGAVTALLDLMRTKPIDWGSWEQGGYGFTIQPCPDDGCGGNHVNSAITLHFSDEHPSQSDAEAIEERLRHEYTEGDYRPHWSMPKEFGEWCKQWFEDDWNRMKKLQVEVGNYFQHHDDYGKVIA